MNCAEKEARPGGVVKKKSEVYLALGEKILFVQLNIRYSI
jgi:hypothetical protein